METVWNILLFGGLIFLMMRFGCGSHMFGRGSKHNKDAHASGGDAHASGGGGCCGGGGKQAEASPGEASAGEARTANDQLRWSPPERDTDPVCGKTISTDNARSSVHDGLVYYFCSGECREAFEASPFQYAGREKETASPRLEQRPAESGGHD